MPDQENHLTRTARNAHAHEQHLQDVKQRLDELYKHLEALANETRDHCRSVKVDGDRFYHSLLRSRPTESAYRRLLKQIKGTGKLLDECARRRAEHDNTVNAVMRERWEKKHGNAPIALPGGSGGAHRSGPGRNSRPTSIFDIGNEESA